MSIETSEASERVLTLERKLYRLRAALDDMVIWRVPTLEQQIAMLWARGPRRQSQVIGEVDGCASAGFPGAEVLVRDTAGRRLGSATAKSDGKYKVWCNLDSDPQDVDIVATPTGTYAARFDGPVVTPATLSVGANAVPAIVIPPTEDWCCGETDYFPGDCACVGDGSHFCVCGCNAPYAITATIGDDEGTHAINAPAPGVNWVSSGLAAAIQTYGATGPNSLCSPADMSWEYTYRMVPLCGTNQWRLRLEFGITQCREIVGGPLVDRPGSLTSQVLTAFAAIDCENPEMVTFTLPTTTSGGLAVPGGGGVVTVVFS